MGTDPTWWFEGDDWTQAKGRSNEEWNLRILHLDDKLWLAVDTETAYYEGHDGVPLKSWDN